MHGAGELGEFVRHVDSPFMEGEVGIFRSRCDSTVYLIELVLACTPTSESAGTCVWYFSSVFSTLFPLLLCRSLESRIARIGLELHESVNICLEPSNVLNLTHSRSRSTDCQKTFTAFHPDISAGTSLHSSSDARPRHSPCLDLASALPSLSPFRTSLVAL